MTLNDESELSSKALHRLLHHIFCIHILLFFKNLTHSYTKIQMSLELSVLNFLLWVVEWCFISLDFSCQNIGKVIKWSEKRKEDMRIKKWSINLDLTYIGWQHFIMTCLWCLHNWNSFVRGMPVDHPYTVLNFSHDCDS